METSWLRWWADVLDSRFRIPGTSIRFGLDPILSLVPGLGDLASPAFTLVLIFQALRVRVPRVVVGRMVLNALADALIGAIPVAGSVADVFWRANTANLALLERHATPRSHPPRPADYLLVYGVAALLLVLLLVPFALALWLAWSAWNWTR